MDEDAARAAVQREAWVRLLALTQLLPAALDAQLQQDSELGHFDYLVLATLAEAPDRVLGMSELAAQTTSSASRLSHAASRLEARGLVERVACPNDRRATNLRLTAAGEREVAQAAPAQARAIRDAVVDPLSDEELAQLSTVAGRIIAALDPGHRLGLAAVCQRAINEPSQSPNAAPASESTSVPSA